MQRMQRMGYHGDCAAVASMRVDISQQRGVEGRGGGLRRCVPEGLVLLGLRMCVWIMFFLGAGAQVGNPVPLHPRCLRVNHPSRQPEERTLGARLGICCPFKTRLVQRWHGVHDCAD
jgi:hypothetical protein